MTRWTIYDEIKDDMDALDRIKAKLLALVETDLTEQQLECLMQAALELRGLRARAQIRLARAEPRRSDTQQKAQRG